jgi:hypothetical protein
MYVTDVSQELLETVLTTFNTEEEKETTRQIVKCFIERGLPVKVKQYNQPCMKDTFRILCFINRSSEAVIINNKGMGRDGVSIQLRIEDRSTLDKISDFSENIRNQILGSADCGYCSSKCGDKKYVFTHKGREYIKCHFLCNNFTFQNIEKSDTDNLIYLINNDITYKQTRRKQHVGKI